MPHLWKQAGENLAGENLWPQGTWREQSSHCQPMPQYWSLKSTNSDGVPLSWHRYALKQKRRNGGSHGLLKYSVYKLVSGARPHGFKTQLCRLLPWT
jgi:hypothetical protein